MYNNVAGPVALILLILLAERTGAQLAGYGKPGGGGGGGRPAGGGGKPAPGGGGGGGGRVVTIG